MTARSSVLLAALLLIPLPGMALAADTADVWLERMNRALHELDYQGRFVYQHGQTLEAMYISHTLRDGKEYERLLSLTGTPREVLRDSDQVTCILPRQEGKDTDTKPTGRRMAPMLLIRPEQLAGYYRFTLGATERVAGRMAQAVLITPRDDLRYGYNLLLDEQHALPLAIATIGTDGRRVSQLQFTDIRIGTGLNETIPGLAAEDEVTTTVKSRQALSSKPSARWRFNDIPGGFTQIGLRHRQMADDDHGVEHFIFSDGLATVSVYLEFQSDDAPSVQRVARLGSVTAMTRQLPGFRATAIGEAPQRTLQLFLDAIETIPEGK